MNTNIYSIYTNVGEKERQRSGSMKKKTNFGLMKNLQFKIINKFNDLGNLVFSIG